MSPGTIITDERQVFWHDGMAEYVVFHAPTESLYAVEMNDADEWVVVFEIKG